MSAPGTLYVVATPIGNLEDLTVRAARVLGEVDAIACEDTRHSRTLLDHYGIQKPLISYYREKEAERAAALLARLQAGESIALITDAGAPLLSDPGARLVALAAAAAVPIVPLPGPSAPITALMAAGCEIGATLPVAFLGFLPARSGQRRRLLEQYRGWPGCLVFFESPHRLLASLADMAGVWGAPCPLLVARELTKIHEEFLRGTVASASVHFASHPPRGEFTLIAGPSPAPPPSSAPPPATRAERNLWARQHGISRAQAYRLWQASYTGKDGG
ncbi:MAG: 16S rRNA (cytidine(1402)-2'-O)-methyltransferase [Terriglobales bacterium]